jgi:hypothetical protein
MSSATPDSPTQRPREVFIAGTLTVAASSAVLFVLVMAMTQLNSAEMRRSLQDFVDANRDRPFTVSIDTARDIFRYTIMAFSVMSGTALVLGIYVLKRHRGARIALTGLGLVSAVWPLFMGPLGWLITLNIAVTLGLLWTRPARAWFDQLDRPPGPTRSPSDWSDSPVIGPPPQPPRASRPGGWPLPSGWGPAPPNPAWPPPSGRLPAPHPAPPTPQSPPVMPTPPHQEAPASGPAGHPDARDEGGSEAETSAGAPGSAEGLGRDIRGGHPPRRASDHLGDATRFAEGETGRQPRRPLQFIHSVA